MMKLEVLTLPAGYPSWLAVPVCPVDRLAAVPAAAAKVPVMQGYMGRQSGGYSKVRLLWIRVIGWGARTIDWYVCGNGIEAVGFWSTGTFIGKHHNPFIGLGNALLQFPQTILDDSNVAISTSIKFYYQSSYFTPDPCYGITIVKGSHYLQPNPYDEKDGNEGLDCEKYNKIVHCFIRKYLYAHQVRGP
jgi:hypothetical protein